MQNIDNKKSFLERHPRTAALILLTAQVIEIGTPQLKSAIKGKADNIKNKLFFTKEKLLGTPDYKLVKLINNAIDKKQPQEEVVAAYQQFNKSLLDQDLLILFFKKCVVDNKLPKVAFKMLEDLDATHYEEALNCALRNSNVEIISHMFQESTFNKPLKLNHLETVNKLLTRSVRYDQGASINYLLEHTRAFTTLNDAPSVFKLLSLCEKDELKTSLYSLVEHNINLLNCETLVKSKFFTENMPKLANEVLQQKLQHVIPHKNKQTTQKKKL